MEKIHASKLLAGLVPAGKLTSDPEVELVTTDSREVKPGCIFVAFPGERFDGHDFAARALEQGAEYVVVNHPVPGVPEEKAILCPDSYHAMMVLGANYRSQFHPKVVGVTGSGQDHHQADDLRRPCRLWRDHQDRGQPEQ